MAPDSAGFQEFMPGVEKPLFKRKMIIGISQPGQNCNGKNYNER
jgi:hypothetical protein